MHIKLLTTRIITQNTSKDVVFGKEVPYGGQDAYI